MSAQGITIKIDAQTAEAAQKLTQFFSSLNGQLSNLLHVAGVAFGVHEISAFIEKAVEANKQLAQLEAALRSTGQASGENTKRLAEQREALEQLIGADNDHTTAVQKILITNGATVDQTVELTKLAYDLAAAQGGEATDAALQLGRAISGQGIQLRGVRLEIDQSLPKYLQYQQMLEQLGSRGIPGLARATYLANKPLADQAIAIDELQKAAGQFAKTNFAEPFASAFTGGIKNATESVKKFNEQHPELVNALKAIADVAGTLGAKLLPLAVTLGAIAVASGTVKIAMSALAPIGAALAIEFARITGFNLAEWFTLASSSAGNLGLALTAILPAMLKFLGVLGAIYGAYRIATEAAKMWAAQAEESESKVRLGRQYDALNEALKNQINNLIKAGEITREHGGELLLMLARSKSAWASGSLSAADYSNQLRGLREEFVKLAAAQKASVEAVQNRAALSKYRDALIAQQNPLNVGKAQSAAAVQAAELKREESALAAFYQKGLFSLEDYYEQRRALIDREATANSNPLIVRQSQIPGEAAALNLQSAQIDEAKATSQDLENKAKLQEQLNKLKLEERQIEDALKIAEEDRLTKSIELSTEEIDAVATAEQQKIAARELGLQRFKEIADKEIEINKRKTDAEVSLLGSAAAAARLFGKQGFIAWKAFALAQAVVAGALAVIKELSQTGWVGAVAAAALAAVQIATIATTEPQGYERGGRPPVGELAIVGERGTELFVPDVAGTIIPHQQTMQLLDGGSGAAAGPQTPTPKVTVYVVSDIREAVQQEMKSPSGGQIIFQHMDGRRLDYGLNT